MYIVDNRETPDEQHIQPASQRQRHGGRGRADRRLAIAPRTHARGPCAPACGHTQVLAVRQEASRLRPWRRPASLASSGFRLLQGRTGRRHAARGLPRVRGRGRLRAVGRAGQPVHQGFRGEVRVADDGREPEDGRRFPSCVVEDGRRRRPSGRGTRQGVDALAVRRPARDRRGRDRLQEGPHVPDRRRRLRAAPGHPGARRGRQGRVRPVPQGVGARTARLHPHRVLLQCLFGSGGWCCFLGL